MLAIEQFPELIGDHNLSTRIPETIQISSKTLFIAAAVVAAVGIGLLIFLILPRLLRIFAANFLPEEALDLYEKVFRPYQNRLGGALLLTISDSLLLLFKDTSIWLNAFEFCLAIAIAINICFLGFGIFKQFFEVYMLDLAIRGEQKANSEILLLYKYLAYSAIILVVILIFAQAHKVNLIGLIASLGIGGVAIALAAQKILEQVLWSTMIYLDRPFIADDYIHLNDGTFGRVESIGWRSTKIRISGKSTLVVIPNSILAQMAIENLSGAQKVISLITITFKQVIPSEERALIRQIILGSTRDIYGLDHRLTEVTFHDLSDESDSGSDSGFVQARITFFILGAGEVSMEIRGQLLSVARQNVMQELKGYGLTFDIEESVTNITSPMNI